MVSKIDGQNWQWRMYITTMVGNRTVIAIRERNGSLCDVDGEIRLVPECARPKHPWINTSMSSRHAPYLAVRRLVQTVYTSSVIRYLLK
jgi:hypothetical protein